MFEPTEKNTMKQTPRQTPVCFCLIQLPNKILNSLDEEISDQEMAGASICPDIAVVNRQRIPEKSDVRHKNDLSIVHYLIFDCWFVRALYATISQLINRSECLNYN